MRFPDDSCPLSGGLLTGTTIMCQCHGSEFDVSSGAVVNGPAPQPLNVYEVQVVEGRVGRAARRSGAAAQRSPHVLLVQRAVIPTDYVELPGGAGTAVAIGPRHVPPCALQVGGVLVVGDRATDLPRYAEHE